MAKRSAADLTSVGLAAIGSGHSELELRLVRAMAAMLAASDKPTKKSVADPLPISPVKLFQAVAENGAILCDPIDKRWFGRLGGLLRNVRVEVGDLHLLLDWFNAGGVASWPQGKPTFTHFLQHLDKWLAFSREWDKRGRPDLTRRGAGSIGLATDNGPTDWSGFK